MKEKLLSGRYFLTVISGLVFAYAVATKLINAEATAAIISMVFMAYFNRNDRKNGNSNP